MWFFNCDWFMWLRVFVLGVSAVLSMFVPVSGVSAVDYDSLVMERLAEVDGPAVSDSAILSCLEEAEGYVGYLDSDSLVAVIYHNLGRYHALRGSLSVAHDYFNRAIGSYSLLESDWAVARMSVCYYQIATSYLNQSDTAGMQSVLELMGEIAEGAPHIASVWYDYCSVLQAYYSLRFSITGDRGDIESSMWYAKRGIYYQSRMSRDEWVAYSVNPVWIYYNVAVCYDLYYDPMPIDSIEKYIALAYEVLDDWNPGRIDSLEVSVSLGDERAWLYYYRGEYDSAVAMMNHVLELIGMIEGQSPNTVITERGEAYSFFVELYSSMGDYKRALEYQQLLEENNGRRYDVDKNRAIHEVKAKYELERREEEIAHLTEQNAVMLRVLLWTVVAGVLLVFVVVLVAVIVRQRRVNAEQRLYEAALEADNSRQGSESSVKLYIDRLKNDFPAYSELFDAVNVDYLNSVVKRSVAPLTAMDMRYIICFASGLKPVQIAEMMNVEPASVYTVRYRLKKKVGEVL